MIPLFSALLRLYLQYYMDSRLHRLERVQRKATEIAEGQGSLPCEERLKELGWFSLEKGRLRGDFITIFQYFKRWLHRRWTLLFYIEESFTGLLLLRFWLDTRKIFHNVVKSVSYWNNPPGN